MEPNKPLLNASWGMLVNSDVFEAKAALFTDSGNACIIWAVAIVHRLTLKGQGR